MIAFDRPVGPDDVRVGFTYAIALARGIITTATIVGQRVVGDQRFVRFRSPDLRLPGNCSAERFAQLVRDAQAE